MKSSHNILGQEKLIIPSDVNQLPRIENFSQHISEKASLNKEKSENLAIVLTELVNNAILHGNKMEVGKKVTLIVIYFSDRVQITVKDEGRGFDPSRLSDPRDPENIWKETGRGIFLVKNLIDDVQFHSTPDGMEIIVTAYKKNGAD
ncbi:MAG: ATP-binding protein [Calditrichaeota bacterium]|nr:ATP-binding protein [Calditrichota bacterium]RQW02642.1 MAG: ATP-binding protein [Calditrichota bacterium]